MFFKKPSVDWIIVGLGNPEDNYAKTRHNAGFRAVDIIAEKVEMINNGISPIQDAEIERYLKEEKLNLTATLDAAMAYAAADFVVIAAPTNYDSQKNKKNNPERIELKKYCPNCKKHTVHKESK